MNWNQIEIEALTLSQDDRLAQAAWSEIVQHPKFPVLIAWIDAHRDDLLVGLDSASLYGRTPDERTLDIGGLAALSDLRASLRATWERAHV